MILEAVVCPDCGELTVRNIQIDEFGSGLGLPKVRCSP